MNKPTKYEGDKNPFYIVKEYRDAGKYITIPFAESGNKDTPRQKEIRRMFDVKHFCYTDANSTESVMYDLNELCDYGKRKFDMPLPDNDIDYILEFENGIILHLNVVDEYHGMGESETAISLIGVIVHDENITDDEINKVIDWLKDLFR